LEVANALEERVEIVVEIGEEASVVVETTTGVTVQICTELPVAIVARVAKCLSDQQGTSPYSAVTVLKQNEMVEMTVEIAVAETLKREIHNLVLEIDDQAITGEVAVERTTKLNYDKSMRHLVRFLKL